MRTGTKRMIVIARGLRAVLREDRDGLVTATPSIVFIAV